MDELRELNFKLLTVFDSVMRNRSISNAAKELGISQPSVSSQLARLRVVLDDDLFIRISNGVLPTTFSESLHPYVCTVLQSLQYGIDQSRKFDQAKEKRTFTLIMTDIGEVTILPELLYRVNKLLELDTPLLNQDLQKKILNRPNMLLRRLKAQAIFSFWRRLLRNLECIEPLV